MQRPSHWRATLALNSLDIIVLIAFGVVQPLFSLLGRSPGFFLAHRSRPIDLAVLVLCAYAVPAALPLLIEWLVALVRPRAVAALHTAILVLLLTIDLLPVAKRLGLPGVVSLLIAAAAGAFLAIVYMRIRSGSRSLVWLSPAVLVFPALLLFFSPASALFWHGRSTKAIHSSIENPVPVVLVVFDEFPLASLMDKDGQIDSKAYPNFAELAHNGTWYRNVTTSGESTLLALPVILSGLYPDPNQPRLPDEVVSGQSVHTARRHLPDECPRKQHPVVPRFIVRGCGPRGPTHRGPFGGCRGAVPVCHFAGRFHPDAARHHAVLEPSPDALQRQSGGVQRRSGAIPRPSHAGELAAVRGPHGLARPAEAVPRVREFDPALATAHAQLPAHSSPARALGVPPVWAAVHAAESRIRGLRGVNDAGLDTHQWTADAWAAAQSYQRHLLQVGFVDRLAGSLVKHLQETGLYDSALLVITADHGASFRADDSRRAVTATNHADIMSVPLFIKYPHQHQGGIDDRKAENVDILPTILDVIGLKSDYRPAGRSLLGPPDMERRLKTVITDREQKFTFPAGLDGLFASVARKLELFGGAGGCDPYRLGDRYGWIGRKAPSTEAEASIRCRLDREAYYKSVDTGAPMLLTNVTGRLERPRGAGTPVPLQLAVAVNGTIRAATQTYFDGGVEKFAALVPEDSLRAGSNDIALFDLRGPAELRSIPRVAAQRYEWGTELRFGDQGNAGPFYGIGWSNPESGITWTDGHLATLVLPVTPPKGDVTLTVNLSGFVSPGKRDHQNVRLLVNHHEVARWVAATDFQDYTVVIPKGDLGGAVVEIGFDLPDAVSPMEMGVGTDPRTLGIAIYNLKLAPQDAL